VIGPYKLRPVPPTVAILTEAGEIVDEHGEAHTFETLPKGTRVWCSYDTVRTLVVDGRGEALCWWGEEIRWRHRRFEEEWRRRETDVTVIHAPFPVGPDGEEDTARSLRGLVAWRDWLDSEGASPVSSLGSASWSLLRSKLTEPLWWSVGNRPPIKQVVGGRQEMGAGGQGHYPGPLYHYDLSAAYARTLGGLQYGGWWNELPLPFDPVRFSGPESRCLFVRARMRIPDLPFGPLIRRPRELFEGRMRQFLALMLGNDYPTSCRLQGVWTWEEIETAVAAGCTIEKILGGWVHVSGGWRPFEEWWRAVERGRGMDDRFGSLLAKMTGNALWGQFCIGSGNGEGRSVTWRERDKRRERTLPPRPSRKPAVDLAETVAGRVRARLYELLASANGGLISAHTDGGWSRAQLDLAEGWRLDGQATGLDLLGPQALRWWPVGQRSTPDPFVVLAGVPAKRAPGTFERLWADHAAAD